MIFHLHDPARYQAIADGACTADLRPLGPLPLQPGDCLAYFDGHPGRETGRHVFAEVTFVHSQGAETFFCFRLLSQLSSITVPASDSQHQLTAFSDPDDAYPGMAIDLDGVTAAVVEWHPTHQTLVVRAYRADAEEPHRYYRWDTGAPLDS